MQPFDCKYKCNHSIAQVFVEIYFNRLSATIISFETGTKKPNKFLLKKLAFVILIIIFAEDIIEYEQRR